jgi:hypothetical protein
MGLKKSLKIQKGYSEFVNRKRTDNTMVIRKSTKGNKNDLQNIHIKLKIEYLISDMTPYEM